tara:strand:- start:75 stop:998 length:924 start_codon:yes stop_codon:yes gene_type:complete
VARKGAMNILITGISGQLGNRLSEILTERGINHRGISRSLDYKTDVPHLCKDLLEIDNEELAEFIKPVTHVIHLADVISESRDFERDLEKQFKNCCLGTIKLLNCLHSNIEHFSFASSYSVYGSPRELPITEQTVLHPENVYSFCKLSTENYLTLFRSMNNIPMAILRIASIYGPGPKKENYSRSVPNMIETVLGGDPPYVCGEGATFRDYMYIDDCINATINASMLKADGIFNIASGVGTTIKELAENIIQISGIQCVLEHRYDAELEWDSVCDIGKMKTGLEYEPKFSIRDGLKLTYEWHKKNRQ